VSSPAPPLVTSATTPSLSPLSPSLHATPEEVRQFKTDRLCSYFTSLGMTDVSSFRKEQIDGEALMELSDAELKDLGVPMGIRKKHLGIIKPH
jgi:hypothetical protein